MKARTVKVRGGPSVVVESTVDVYTGKPLVILLTPHDDETTLRPIEADRLIAALQAAVKDARTKR